MLKLNQKGFGILEVLVFIGVITMLSYYLFQKQTNTINEMLSHYNKITNKEFLKKKILAEMDCGKTIQTIDPDWIQCTENARLTIYSRDTTNPILIKGTGTFTTWGNIQIKSRCIKCIKCWAPSNFEIGFEFRRVDSLGNPLKDNLFGDTRWSQIFKDGELSCIFQH